MSVVGSGSSPAMLAARALLAGNGVAHRWLDTDTDPIGRLLADRAGLGVEQPVAVFADGSRLAAPVRLRRARSPARQTAGRRASCPSPARRVTAWFGPARTPPELVERYIASARWRTELAHRAGLRTRPQNGGMRRGHHRRRPGRADRRRLRRLGRTAHRGPRTRGAGRAGGHQRADRELPWVPAGHQRRRVDRAARTSRRCASAPRSSPASSSSGRIRSRTARRSSSSPAAPACAHAPR